MINYFRSFLVKKAQPKDIRLLLRAGRLERAAALINQICEPLSIRLGWGNDQSFTAIEWQAQSPTRANFVISRLMPHDRIDFFVTRFLQTLPLITCYHQSVDFVSKSMTLNLDDSADLPGIAFCSNRSDSLLIPDTDFIQSFGYQQLREATIQRPIPWEHRLPVVFWRGSSTGVREGRTWQTIPRVRMCSLLQSVNPDLQAYFDVGIVSLAQMAAWERHEFLQTSTLKAFVPINKSACYRYQIDIDGNTNAWAGLFQKLLMGCTVLKVDSPSAFRQWYYQKLQPFVHFIPIKSNFEDLAEKVQWAIDHPLEAKQIARNGQALALAMDYATEIQAATRRISMHSFE